MLSIARRHCHPRRLGNLRSPHGSCSRKTTANSPPASAATLNPLASPFTRRRSIRSTAPPSFRLNWNSAGAASLLRGNAGDRRHTYSRWKSRENCWHPCRPIPCETPATAQIAQSGCFAETRASRILSTRRASSDISALNFPRSTKLVSPAGESATGSAQVGLRGSK